MSKLPKHLRVEVTQEDINRGDVSSHSCPIALAIRRTYGLDEYDVKVDEDDIVLDDDLSVGTDDGVTLLHAYRRRHYIQSVRALRFIEKFDADKMVKPTVFRFHEEK